LHANRFYTASLAKSLGKKQRPAMWLVFVSLIKELFLVAHTGFEPVSLP
jgi:hypothetical protein